MHTSSTSGEASAKAAELVDWCLEHIDTLVGGYLGQLKTIEGYAHVSIPFEDLRETTRDALELILRKFAGMPVTERLATVSESIGRRRASQGVPLEVLMQAVRMVFRLLWTTLHSQATPPQREALDQSAVQLWEAIEYHTVRVHAGYLNEVSRMHRDRETELTILLADFLDRDRSDASLTVHVGRTLGLIPEESVLVAAAPLTAVTDVRARAGHAGPRVQVHQRSDTVMILQANPSTSGAQPSWMEGFPCAIAPIAENLAAVPAAWRIAHDVLIAAPPGSPNPMTLAEGWPHLLVTLLPDLTDTIHKDTMGELGSVTPDSLRQLRTTVETYMRTGSLMETSQRLFCHRNTVLKRLTRFKELTGLDASVPWDAATIRVALATLPRD